MPSATRPPRNRPVVLVVSAMYLVALGFILLGPEHVDHSVGFLYPTIYDAFPHADPEVVDFVLNILLFLPFGALLAPLLPRHPWLAIGIAWVVPLIVEVAQGVFLPTRDSSVFDVAANTVGGLIGALIVEGIRAGITRRRTRGRR